MPDLKEILQGKKPEQYSWWINFMLMVNCSTIRSPPPGSNSFLYNVYTMHISVKGSGKVVFVLLMSISLVMLVVLVFGIHLLCIH